MKKYCYADGKVKLLKEAKVQATDLAVMRGYAVFDFMRIYNKKPFHFKDHFRRFKNSAKALKLTVPVTEKEVENIIDELLKKNKASDVSARLLLTGGDSEDGITMKKDASKFFVFLDDQHNLPKEVFTKGGKLITCRHERVIPQAKNTNYIPAVLNRALMLKKKAIEILYTHDAKILECSTSNFFLVKGKKVITPKERVLGGITRKIVLSLAKKHYEVEERDILVEELKEANEAFITATNKLVAPIVKVDNIKIGNGKIGEVTKNLLELYKKEIEKICY